MSKIIYEKESYRIIGACFKVYKEKGCGFTESVYQECLEIEFEYQNIPFVSQPSVQLEYRQKRLQQHFKPDFICFDKIIVELKSVANLIAGHRSQAMNYLNATSFDLALLVNFGHHPLLEYERIGSRESLRKIRNELKGWTKNG
ncbi:MAG: GxxExxY protein [Pyrinomonadaceae bacterium]|nr:GxxExxY protein [Pyrinomonadaceae bacterium]